MMLWLSVRCKTSMQDKGMIQEQTNGLKGVRCRYDKHARQVIKVSVTNDVVVECKVQDKHARKRRETCET